MDSIRVVTAAALFDGHDVSINIFRRLLQKRGAEVIHLGHNRSVSEVVRVAVQEDADAVLISSYQGGHNEYFRYMVDSFKERGTEHIMVFGGGGGVILPSEIKQLEEYGVTKLYHATDGQKIGIDGIADDIIKRIKEYKSENKDRYLSHIPEEMIEKNEPGKAADIAKQLSFIEANIENDEKLREVSELYDKYDKGRSLVIGVTGTGGSGKSSLIDEIIGRCLTFSDNIKVAVLAIDPSKSRGGGALLGDPIRYNQIYNDRVYFRSYATRQSINEMSGAVQDSIKVLKSCGYDIIFVETSGIGQGNSAVVDVSDYSMYVMTAEFGAPSQLEKIYMLDVANFIAINKFEKVGSEDAFREVKINYIRTHNVKADHRTPLEELDVPVYACSSNEFNNHGVNRIFKDIIDLLKKEKDNGYGLHDEIIELLPTSLDRDFGLLDNSRINYLSEIAKTLEKYHRNADTEAEKAREAYAFKLASEQLDGEDEDNKLKELYKKKYSALDDRTKTFIDSWQDTKDKYLQDELNYEIHGKEYSLKLFNESLAGTKIPKVIPPTYESWRELVKFYYKENLPGEFPYTAGVFPFKRTTEDPKRQFAGEGGPKRTNKRFKYLTEGDKAKRLSVAFDGITLYGEDPDRQPDNYGKIGESGVSICTINDMDTLLDGFDQTDPFTSVSMTINAPAPIMVAFYFMVAYKRALEKAKSQCRELNGQEKNELKVKTFRQLRGTVQADMLKEDQGQNTCIFSIDFAMKLIGDVQEFLSKYGVKNYYSLSISGYHIAEAGANPITQLAFTLANGFTYVEYFLNRGLKIDEFAPNLSFFFSNGMDPEYSVIGRVARRIWAVAMRDRYGANERSQKLKYHIQTSGRSLHAQEIDFNDIRTTLQGLIAYNDNCNSLHTNSYDEAVTTPTEESVRRSMAIQMILANEFGLLKNENPNQGSFLIELLTDLVEEAVLEEFRRISRRGGVLGAMETQYQRSKIQEESLYYETLKQTGEYPIIGVNKFTRDDGDSAYDNMQITRSDKEEKEEILGNLDHFQKEHKDEAQVALDKLKEVALTKGNIFEELLNTVEYASMGQITQLLYEIGGKYRRGM